MPRPADGPEHSVLPIPDREQVGVRVRGDRENSTPGERLKIAMARR